MYRAFEEYLGFYFLKHTQIHHLNSIHSNLFLVQNQKILSLNSIREYNPDRT